MSISPDLLNDALEGRAVLGASHAEAAGLVRLASAVRRLEPQAPGPAARARMRADFEQVMAGRRRRPFGLLLPWLGAGGQPRPLAQRLAAGVMILAVAGSAGTAAAGSNPLDATVAVVRFAENLVVNLDPNRDSHLTTPTPTPEPNNERGLGAAATSSAQEEADNNTTGPTATPSATATPPANFGAPGVIGNAVTGPGTQGTNDASPPMHQPAGDVSRGTPPAPPTQDGTASATPSPSPTPTATKTPTPGSTPKPGSTSGPPVLAPTPGTGGGSTPTATNTPSPSSTPHDDHEDDTTPTATPSRTRTATATPTSDDHEDNH